jgi:hypothetical protein
MPTIKIIATPSLNSLKQDETMDSFIDKQNIPGISKIQSISIKVGRVA